MSGFLWIVGGCASVNGWGRKCQVVLWLFYGLNEGICVYQWMHWLVLNTLCFLRAGKAYKCGGRIAGSVENQKPSLFAIVRVSVCVCVGMRVFVCVQYACVGLSADVGEEKGSDSKIFLKQNNWVYYSKLRCIYQEARRHMLLRNNMKFLARPHTMISACLLILTLTTKKKKFLLS